MNPSEQDTPAEKQDKQRALCVATRCTTIEQFVATFHRFCDESSFFVATLSMRPVGLETAFSIQLEDKTPVLRGLCVVVEAWATPANRFGRPGVRLDVRRLTDESLEVFKMLQRAREADAMREANNAANALSQAMAAAATKAEAEVRESSKLVALGTPPPMPVTQPLPRLSIPASSPKARGSVAVLEPGKTTAKLDATAFTTKTPPPTPPVVATTAGEKLAAKLAAAATQPAPRPHTDTIRTETKLVEPPPVAAVSEPPVVETKRTRPAITGRIRQRMETLKTTPVDPASVVVEETRAPGSAYILPANPLMNLTDSSLEGFIDCALYEETSNFFRTQEDASVDAGQIGAPSLVPVLALRSGPATDDPPSYVGPMPQPEAPQVQMMFGGATSPPPFVASVPPAAMRASSNTGPILLTASAVRAPSNTGPIFIPPVDGMRAHTQTGPMPPAYVVISAEPARPATGSMPPMSAHDQALLGHAPEYQEPAYPMMPMMAAPGAFAPITGSFTPPLSHAVPRGPQERRRTMVTSTVRSRRPLVIGGSALAAIAVVVTIVLASSGGGEKATAATPSPSRLAVAPSTKTAPTTPKAAPTAPAITTSKVAPRVEAAAPSDPGSDPSVEPPADVADEAPPVIGSGPCQMSIATTPAGSIVRVDNRAIGPSPITVAGPCKRTKIEAKHPRYALATKWVTPQEGRQESVDMPMVRPTHAVTITSNPAGATVLIGGRRAGTTPTSVNLMGFTTQTLTFEKKGYSKVTQKLYSKTASDRVTVKLTRGK